MYIEFLGYVTLGAVSYEFFRIISYYILHKKFPMEESDLEILSLKIIIENKDSEIKALQDKCLELKNKCDSHEKQIEKILTKVIS